MGATNLNNLDSISNNQFGQNPQSTSTPQTQNLYQNPQNNYSNQIPNNNYQSQNNNYQVENNNYQATNNTGLYTESSKTTKTLKGRSWAGSFNTINTLIGAKKFGLLFLYFGLLFPSILIPFLAPIFFFGFFIAGGLNGKKRISSRHDLDTIEKQIGAIKYAETLGKFRAIIKITAILIPIALAFLLGKSLNSDLFTNIIGNFMNTNLGSGNIINF